jgi:hypothetical protein
MVQDIPEGRFKAAVSQRRARNNAQRTLSSSGKAAKYRDFSRDFRGSLHMVALQYEKGESQTLALALRS